MSFATVVGSERGYTGPAMRATVCALILAGAAALAAGAGATPPPGPATAVVSSARHGARPVALTVSFRAELQCGHLMAKAVALGLPAAAVVPRTVPAAAVVVAGRRASSVTVTGHTLTISLTPAIGLATCNALTVGTARVTVGPAAMIGNPAAPGRYRISVASGGETYAAALTIA